MVAWRVSANDKDIDKYYVGTDNRSSDDPMDK